MEIPRRSNEDWLAQLSGTHSVQQTAISDLRAILLRALRFAVPVEGEGSYLEDSVQDSVVLILDRLQQFEGRSRFLTWATSIAIRVAMTMRRRHRWQDVSFEEVIDDAGFTPDASMDSDLGPEIQSARTAILSKMHDVIQSDLTNKQRDALLAELKGMPQDEIARHLKSNRNAVYKLTHDARKRLKQGLEAAGYHGEDVQAAFAM